MLKKNTESNSGNTQPAEKDRISKLKIIALIIVCVLILCLVTREGSDQMFNHNQIHFSKIDEVKEALKSKERPHSSFRGPQWVTWMAHKEYRGQEEKFFEVLDKLKNFLEPNELGIMYDALAFGNTNVTPYRLQWTVKYAPEEAKAMFPHILKRKYNEEGIEDLVIAATPLNPAEYYQDLWVRFKSSHLQAENAYEWVKG